LKEKIVDYFETVDVRSEADPEKEALLRGRKILARTFDLARGPLLRAGLIRARDHVHFFVVSLHHLIFDGWSRRVFEQQLIECYKWLAEGSEPEPSPLQVQFADFARWHREFVESDAQQEGEEWWRSQMEHPFAPSILPGSAGRLRPTGPCITMLWSVTEEVRAGLTRLAEEEDTTRFVVFLAAWKALWYRYTAAKETLVFTSWGNRARRELHNLVGFFANVLPIRCELSADLTVRELVQRVRSQQLGALEHQSVPFETILKSLRLPPQSTSVFQTLIMYQRGLSEHDMGTTRFLPANEFCSRQRKFVFTIEAEETGRHMEGLLRYRTDAIGVETGPIVLSDFLRILEVFASNPDAPLSRLPISKIKPEPSGENTISSAGTIAEKTKRHADPRFALEAQLVQLWEEVLGVPVGIHDDFFELGGDSFAAVAIFARVEKLIGRRLPMLASLFEANTIERLAALIQNGAGSPTWSSLVPIQPQGSRSPFYGIHGVGGNILEFVRLARNLDPEQPLYGIQAQGLDGRVDPHRSVPEMAAHYTREIQKFQPKGPYFIGGCSFGGVVAWEIAQQLLAAGEEIGCLVLIDSRAESKDRVASISIDRWSGLRSLASLLIHPGSISSEWRKFQQEYSLPKQVRRVREAGRTASRLYVTQPLNCSVVLLRATEQSAKLSGDPTNGWRPLVEGSLTVREVSGSHATIMNAGAPSLARELAECLRAAQPNLKS